MTPTMKTTLRAAAVLAACLAVAACREKDVPKIDGGGAGIDMPAPKTGTASPDGAGHVSGPVSGPGPRTGTGSGGAAPKPVPGGLRPEKHGPIDLSVTPGTMPTAAQARAVIDAAAAAGASDPDLAAQALGYLVALGDTAAVRAAAAKLLAPGEDTGGYADRDLAAAALGALLRAGEADAGPKAVALAKALLEERTSSEALLPALANVKGALRGDALALLARFAEDMMVREEALAALAEARAQEGSAAFAKAADGKQESSIARAAGVSGLLALGAPGAETAAERLAVAVNEDVEPDGALQGLASARDASALPLIRRIVADSLKEGEDLAAIEIAAASRALVDIRGYGRGQEDDRAWLRSLLGKDDGDADPDVRTALWALGDDSEAKGAADVLERCLGGLRHGFDEEPAVEVLEIVAFRRAAADPAFEKLVASAASLPADLSAKRPDVAGRAARVRLAAAWAVLASSRR